MLLIFLVASGDGTSVFVKDESPICGISFTYPGSKEIIHIGEWFLPHGLLKSAALFPSKRTPRNRMKREEIIMTTTKIMTKTAMQKIYLAKLQTANSMRQRLRQCRRLRLLQVNVWKKID